MTERQETRRAALLAKLREAGIPLCDRDSVSLPGGYIQITRQGRLKIDVNLNMEKVGKLGAVRLASIIKFLQEAL